jgi:hypothetical protein
MDISANFICLIISEMNLKFKLIIKIIFYYILCFRLARFVVVSIEVRLGFLLCLQILPAVTVF